MSKWKDETSYSRGAKKREPTVVALGLPYGLKLVVHKLIHAKDYWFFTIKWSNSFLIQDRQLHAVQIEDAKAEGLKNAAELLRGWSLAFEEGAVACAKMVLTDGGGSK